MTSRRFAWLLLVGVLACGGTLPAATFIPTGFSETPIATGLDPTTMAFAPDGRLFVCEKPGRVRVIKLVGSTYTLLPTSFVDLTATVNATNERGLMSVCFDPAFASNGYVYLYYTTSAAPQHNRVSRFTASGDLAVNNSELVIIDFDALPGTVHNGGAMRFGLDGKLYVAAGEGSQPGNSQDTAKLLGKLLRLNADGSIPTDNPNYGTFTGNMRAIVGMGLRNPYTMAIQPGTGLMYLNDVGGANYEEVNFYATGSAPAKANYGWGMVDNIEGSIGGQIPPADYRNPVHSYGHGLGTAICGSTFYNPVAPTGVAFPSATYTGRYFFCDYGDYAANTGEIYSIDPANPATSVLFANAVNRPIAILVADDGALWYVARGGIVNGGAGSEADNGSVGTGGAIYRITYTGGGAATKVTFVQQPTDCDAGTTIIPAVTVALRDNANVIVNSNATVTLVPSTGTLSGTTSVAAVAGIATFSDLSIIAPGTYSMRANSGVLTQDTSNNFDVRANTVTPVIAPGTGTFGGPVWVQITSTTPDAEIRYTINNTAPTVGSALYSGPFQITGTTVVRAFARKTTLNDSGEASATMTISGTTAYGWPTRPPVSGVAMPATVGGTLPATLSATNLFSSLATLTTNAGIIPYDVNSPLWSDGAHKRRWVALPGASRIAFAPTGEYTWPGGTIFVKHFELETNQVTHLSKRLETRVLVLDSVGTNGYGVTYQWNDAGTEATLVATDGLDQTLSITTASGTHAQTWHYPARSQCLQCHNQNAGFVLGPKTRQLNGTYAYPGANSDNQLRTWNYLRMFTTDIGEGSIAALAKLVTVDDGSASLEKRARSYLDANCAPCHRPGGSPAAWDARFDTDLDAQQIINGGLTNNLGITASRVVVPQDTSLSAMHVRLTSTTAGVQMPPLARNVVDPQAMATIAQWISSLPNGSGLNGEYRNELKAFATTPVLTRTDPTVAFLWAASPGTGVNADTFTVRWTGSVVPRFSEAYTFFVTSDDGARLSVNGTQVIDQWVDQGPTEAAGTPITLTAGTRYDLTLEFYENNGGAEVTLRWLSANQAKSVVPMYRLSPTAAVVVGPVPTPPSAPFVSGNGTTAPTLSGTGGTAGSIIHILVDGVEVGSTTVQTDGTWSYTLTGLSPGSHQVTVTASAATGSSGASTATTVTISGATGGGSSSSSSSSSSSCGLGGGLAALGLFLIIWLVRPLRLRHRRH
jgi:uncharacterized repeat protein (TIGR03806 family)